MSKFDQIDATRTDKYGNQAKTFFREQAYAFEWLAKQIDQDDAGNPIYDPETVSKIRVSLAVINPLPLLPFPVKNYKDILKNIDAVCEIGRNGSFVCEAANEFMSEFSTGMHILYIQKKKELEEQGRNFDYVVFSAIMDCKEKQYINDCVGDLEIGIEEDLEISEYSFDNYGEQGDTANVIAARRLEEYGRNNTRINHSHDYLLEKNPHIVDSMGHYAVWIAGRIIKKAISKFSNSVHSLHLIKSKSDQKIFERSDCTAPWEEKTLQLHFYQSLKEIYNNGNENASAELTKPLESPASLVNLLQAISDKQKRHPVFGQREMKHLLPALQMRNDEGVRRSELINERIRLEEKQGRDQRLEARSEKKQALRRQQETAQTITAEDYPGEVLSFAQEMILETTGAAPSVLSPVLPSEELVAPKMILPKVSPEVRKKLDLKKAQLKRAQLIHAKML